MQKTIKHKASSPCKVPDLGIDVAAGDIVEIPEGYARPRQLQTGQKGRPIIADLAPQLQPVNPADIDEVLPEGGPTQTRPPRLPTLAELVASGLSEGLAEQLVNAMQAGLTVSKVQPKPRQGADAAKGNPGASGDAK